MLNKVELTGARKVIIIEVKERDLDAVFDILSSNGRFSGLPNNRFRIDENAKKTIEGIEKAGIKVKVIENTED